MKVSLSWLIYIIAAFATRNTYVILEQIGNLFLGSGFGWLILMLILIIGIILGALGGGLGYSFAVLIKPFFQKRLKD
jgi:cell division protein FtsX